LDLLRPDFMLAHQWYILPRSPPYLLAFDLNELTEPLQLAPARFTLPGLLLPFTLPSAKFSENSCHSMCNFLTFLYSSPGFTSFVVFCLVMMPTPAASSLARLLPLFRKSNLLFGPVPGRCIRPIGLMVCGIMMNSRIFITSVCFSASTDVCCVRLSSRPRNQRSRTVCCPPASRTVRSVSV